MFNTTVEDIKTLNNLTSNEIYIGQELLINNNLEEIIPPVETEYENYTVQKGDSLWSISQKYNISVDELINMNNLADLKLEINQILKVPKQDNNLDYDLYTVQKGDTLWSISRKYNIPVEEIKQFNNLSNNLLSIGQQLKIKKELNLL